VLPAAKRQDAAKKTMLTARFNNILFVCLGNICRSPMAEGYFREQLKSAQSIQIGSAGLRALVGQPAVSEAQEIMHQIGIDISAHRARQLTNELVVAADLILVMEKPHQQEIEFIFPHSRGRVHLLGKWGDFEIFDPYQGSIEAFSECLALIEKGWQDWKNRL
jgi:protein-tyrosine phosphatase